MNTSDKPGAKLKAMRLEKRLTLTELSSRTGMPISTISKVENDKMALSYDKLQSLSAGLGMDVGVLFKSPFAQSASTPSGRRSVHKNGDGRRVETHLNSYRYLASELLNKHFIPLVTEVRARTLEAFGEMLSHPGEEFTYVLEGSVEFHSQAYTPVQLNAGESVYFDSGMPHAYVAVGKGPCRTLTICSSTEAQLFDAVDRSRPPRPRDGEAPKMEVHRRKPAAKQKQTAVKTTDAPTKPARRVKP
jgi:transcriptional regulator with XRE-family HTH domain